MKQSVLCWPLLASWSPLDTLNVIKLSVQAGSQKLWVFASAPGPPSPPPLLHRPPPGHSVNVSLTIVNRLKQRGATITVSVPVLALVVALPLWSPQAHRILHPRGGCLPVYMLNAFWPKNVCQFYACRLLWIALFCSGADTCIIVVCKARPACCNCPSPTLPVKFRGTDARGEICSEMPVKKVPRWRSEADEWQQKKLAKSSLGRDTTSDWFRIEKGFYI